METRSMQIQLTVNGKSTTVDVPPHTLLVQVLRPMTSFLTRATVLAFLALPKQDIVSSNLITRSHI